MTEENKGHAADTARREREKALGQDKSGTHEPRPNPEAEDDIRDEAADRAASAAIGHKPSG